MSAALPIFCLDWHVTKSQAFHDLLLRPLELHVHPVLRSWDRNSSSLGDLRALAGAGPVVFCQAPPPRELAELPGARVAWAPMWDEMRTYQTSVWDELPRSIRVVAFSGAVAERTVAMDFSTLRIQYFIDPGTVEPASWREGPVLFYWNRTGIFGPHFLARLCRSIGATRLIFRSQIDPRVSQRAAFRLPAKVAGTEVWEIPASLPRDDYLRLISSANVFLAPRACEGVGLTLLEAMARGQAALACDAPAMNEYLTHEEDGVLLKMSPPPRPTFLPLKQLAWFGPCKPLQRPNADLEPAERQDWEAIASLDLQALGRRARERQETGFETWRERLPELASFLLDWPLRQGNR